MPDGWATAMMELVLHVNKDQAQRDIDKLDGTKGGRAAGQQFGTAFSREQLTRMNAGMTQFAAGATRTSDQAGQESGRTFGQSFTQLGRGIVASFFRGTTQTRLDQASQGAGSSSGAGFGAGFTRDAAGRLRDFEGKFIADSRRAGDQAGQQAGTSFGRSFGQLASGIVSSFIRGAVQTELAKLALPAAARSGPGAAGRGLAAGIGPGILGLGVKSAGIIGLGGAGLGAVPALLAGGLGAGVAGGGAAALAGTFGIVQSQVSDAMKARTQAQQAAESATTPAQQQAAAAKLAQANEQIRQLSPALQSIIKSETTIQAQWEKFAKSLAPLVAGPLAQVARLFGGLTGPLHQFFAGAATTAQPLITGLDGLARAVLPLLGQAFRAAAPLLAPLIAGLTRLATGLLPGVITLLKAAGPAVAVLSRFLAQLGAGLGGMLAAFAPVVTASARILGALLGLLTALLPVIGQLAAVFARQLSPVFAQFAGVVQSLLPFLVTIARLVASLAGAILGDLVAAFGAISAMLRAIGPSLDAFARAIGGVFTILENSGVFALLGDAIEAIARPLGQLVTAILRGLTPIIPPLISFITRLTVILTSGLAAAIAALLPPLTTLATTVLAALVQVLPLLLPPFLVLTQILTAVFVRVITDLAIALNAVLSAIPPRLLSSIAIGVLAIVAAFRLWAAGTALIGLVTSPIGLVIAAVALLAIGITELVTHWHQVWGAIQAAAAATGRFFTRLFRTQVVQDILAVWSIGLIPLAQHWSQVWSAITSTATAAWHGLYRATLGPMTNWFTVSLPHALGVAVSRLHQWWSDVAGAFSAGWNAVWRTTIQPMENLFTKDLPGWFHTAVQALGRFWSSLGSTVRAPVAWMVNHVLNGLIGAFDWITDHIGLKSVHISKITGWAGGGRINQGTTERADDVLAAVSRNETIVSAAHSRVLAPVFRAIGIPGYGSGGRVLGGPSAGLLNLLGIRGYQQGGIVMPPTAQRPGTPTISPTAGATDRIGQSAPGAIGHAIATFAGKVFDLGRITAALATGNTAALANAFSALTGQRPPGLGAGVLMETLLQIPKTLIHDVVNWLIGQAGGASASAIVNYAQSFLGRVPYVWGGTQLPLGADCSGFTQAVYRHFGIIAPRTSEQQGAWVRRSGPQPGGLAFYHCLPGDQPVLTSAGPVPIGRVEAGMMVATWNGGLPAWRRCAGRSAPRRQLTYRVSTATTALEASGNHPFLTARVHGWDWTQVDDLRPGDLVCRYDEAAGDFREEAVTAIEPLTETDTYDIGVEGTHCFIAAGLVVHNSPPGGPDPGHVAIVKNAATVISQGGGTGPQLMALHAMPLLWTGVPPGGFGRAGSLGNPAATGPLQQYARRLVDNMWGDAQWPPFADIVQRESGWRVNATNPASGAYGIPQSLPASKMASAGADWRTNGYTQLRWMVDYIRSQWGTPANADRNEELNHWYRGGGWVNEPVTGVGKYTRALYHFAEHGREYVTPEADMPDAGGSAGSIVGELRALRGALNDVPARTAAGVARAVTVPQSQQATAARIGAR